MNTLSKAITSSIMGEDTYTALVQKWSEIVNSDARHGLTSAHHLLYAVLRGTDWRKGFCATDEAGNYVSPIVNANKLANGGDMNWGAIHSIRRLSYKPDIESLIAPFGGIVTPEMVCKASKLLPATSYYSALDVSEAYPNAIAASLAVSE
jgi:hypothetical protein